MLDVCSLETVFHADHYFWTSLFTMILIFKALNFFDLIILVIN